MGFVHIEPVYTKLLKGNNAVFAFPCFELLQPFNQPFFGAFKLLDGKALAAACLNFSYALLNFTNLLSEQAFLSFKRNRDTLKLAVSDDDRIVFACGNPRTKLLSVFRFKVLFSGDKDICRRVQP